MNLNHNIPPETFERIEQYLLQQMPAAEKESFEQTVAGDMVVQEQVQQVRLTITAIKEKELGEKLHTFHEGIAKRETAPVKSIGWKLPKRWLVAASVAVLLSLAGIWFFTKPTVNEQLFSTYFKPDPGLISAMGSTDNYVFDKAMIDYKTGKYNLAITAWQGLLKSDTNNDTLNYFIGASYIALKDIKAATPYLQKVTAMPQSYFVKDACWYLGLAMLQQERFKEAIDLISKSDHPQKEKLLEEINKNNNAK